VGDKEVGLGSLSWSCCSLGTGHEGMDVGVRWLGGGEIKISAGVLGSVM
jgi:hypothetical protein